MPISNEELVRDYLNRLDSSEINASVHLIDMNFEKVSYESILSAIYSLYLDVAKSSQLVANNFKSEDGNDILDTDHERIIEENRAMANVLNKLIDYKPISKDLSEYIKSKANETMKKTS